MTTGSTEASEADESSISDGGRSASELAERANRLAEERTKLARERTTLAHIRTGFSSFLFGAALHAVFRSRLSFAVGVVFVVVGFAFVATGGMSYLMSRRRMRQVLEVIEPLRYD